MKLSPEKYVRYLAPLSVALGVSALYYYLPPEWTNIRKFGIIMAILLLNLGNLVFSLETLLRIVVRLKEQTSLISALIDLVRGIIDLDSKTNKILDRLISLVASGNIKTFEPSHSQEKESLDKTKADLIALNVSLAELKGAYPHLATKAEVSEMIWKFLEKIGWMIVIASAIIGALKFLKITP